MAESEQFKFVNVANFCVYIDQLPAFEKYLKMAVDTILGIQPQKVHISQFCIDHCYRNKEIPKNWVKDTVDEGYWELTPAHYWLENLDQPLEVCIIGSGSRVNIDRIKERGRITFADQKSLVEKVMEIVSVKTFEKDILPHIPKGQMRNEDINEGLLQKILAQPPTFFSGKPGDSAVVTGEDLRGIEAIGYTLKQLFIRQSPLCEENILKIGLCKTYYPK